MLGSAAAGRLPRHTHKGLALSASHLSAEECMAKRPAGVQHTPRPAGYAHWHYCLACYLLRRMHAQDSVDSRAPAAEGTARKASNDRWAAHSI